MRYSAVIFDLDGTLLDSMPFYAVSWQQAFRELHQIDIDDNSAYQLEGAQAEEFVRDIAREHLGRDLSAKVITETYLRQRVIFDSLFEPRFFPGADLAVQTPREFGARVGLVSGSKRAEIMLKTKTDPTFLDAFDVIISGEDTPRGKPHPEPFLAACERLGCSPASTLVVENAPLGLRSAIAAGTECWVVQNNSPIGTAWASEHGATHVAADLHEIVAAITRELQRAANS